jgi:hypothetical protein
MALNLNNFLKRKKTRRRRYGRKGESEKYE